MWLFWVAIGSVGAWTAWILSHSKRPDNSNDAEQSTLYTPSEEEPAHEAQHDDPSESSGSGSGNGSNPSSASNGGGSGQSSNGPSTSNPASVFTSVPSAKKVTDEAAMQDKAVAAKAVSQKTISNPKAEQVFSVSHKTNNPPSTPSKSAKKVSFVPSTNRRVNVVYKK